MVFGLLPGLSGLAALAVLIPFVYKMEPFQGLAFLLTCHAVVYTGGSLTAILLGIPGSPPNAATIVDGVPMRRKGLGGVAVGAALGASGLGGIFGALVLISLLPILQSVVMLFGPADAFLLSLLGLTFIAVMGSGSAWLGLFAGGLGLFMSFIGDEPISGVPRYWFGSEYLLDGIRIIPVALGLFAIPELLSLMAGRELSQTKGDFSGHQALQGLREVLKRPWLAIRSSAIGAAVGIVPGAGGETAPFVAYALAKQWDRDPSRYGTGVVEGVIAPEASNNAKEGGALVPTLAFGIPGSSGMALLLGAFLILGLQPGPDFLREHMDISVGLVIVLAVANLLAAALMILLAPMLTRVLSVPQSYLVPILLTLVVLGAYSTANDMRDVLALFIMGVMGVVFVRFGINRAPFLLAFVLGPSVERYLQVSLNIYGGEFLLRPTAIVIIGIAVLAFAAPLVRQRLQRRKA